MKAPIISFVFFILVSFNVFSQISIADLENIVNKNICKVETIDYNRESLDDLKFLKHKIGDASIVILGEPNHGDSTANLAKNRLVKYLYKEMGFKVILLEEIFYTLEKAKENDKIGVVTYKNFMKLLDYPIDSYEYLDFWSLVENLNKNGDSCKLNVSGFDLDGNINFLNDLETEICKYDSTVVLEEEWKRFSGFYKSVTRDNKYSLKKDYLFSEKYCDFLIARFNRWDEKSIWIQFIKNFKGTSKFYYKKPQRNKNNVEFSCYNLRDEQIADNIDWMINNIYKGKKIIISTSSYHTANNTSEIKSKEFKNAVTFSQRLHEKYTDKIYSIAIVSYSGIVGAYMNFQDSIPPKRTDNLESIIHKQEYEYAFIDLKSTDFNNKWFYLSPVYLKPMKAKWNNVYDALFYIDKVEPLHKSFDTFKYFNPNNER